MNGPRRSLILLHGWGCDATVWDRVVPLLHHVDIIRLDRGYFGSCVSCDAPPQGTIAVGHSFGAMWLARRWPDMPLVAINGFDRFCGDNAVPPRVLARMMAKFAQAPEAVLAEFRKTIGAPPAPSIASAEALGNDLARLADTNPAPPRIGKLLVLQASDDPLLPAALRMSAFGKKAATSPHGGHMLPLSRPDWCAAQIMAFAS